MTPEEYIAKLEEEIENHKQNIMQDELEIIPKLEEENKKLKERVSELEDVSKDYDLLSKDFIELGEENKKLKEEIRFLEQCLDNKEKVNKNLREELEKLKSTYVYDAKQVRDIC